MQPDSLAHAISDSLSHALDHTIAHNLALDASSGLHGRRLVELGHMLGHMRRRLRVSHTRCAEADCRQRGGVPRDLDGEPVQHGSLPRRLRHQSAVKYAPRFECACPRNRLHGAVPLVRS